MPEEIGATLANLQNQIETHWGDLRITSGEWYEHGENCPSLYISVAWSGWGKVSAARAATRLLGTSFRGKSIDIILFTGVAGAANSTLNQWDIVIPTELVQHDMDARPLFQRYVIPALKKERITSIPQWVDWASSVLKDSITHKRFEHFGRVETGLIATGDRFIAEKSLLDNLSRERFDRVQSHRGHVMEPGGGYGAERHGFPHQPWEHARQNRRSFRQTARKGKSVRKTRTRRKGTKRKKQPR